ncbi:MAG: hypothetical protein QME05_00490 [Candidatus Margulisbacteria bacterium]|nr:hypothetical protein [Candidatus Margulisiibacteriota bacterium]
MGIYDILINLLIFCGIGLLIALIVATIMVILILLDLRRTAKEVGDKVKAIASILDIVGMLFGGMGAIKKKLGGNLGANSAAIVGFAAGLKKALQVLLKK